MPPHVYAKRESTDSNNGSVFASFIVFLSIFIVFLSYGVWRRRQLARRQHAMMVEWGLAGIDGLHDPDGTWPWWGRPPPRVELQPPQFVEVWIAHDAKDRGAEPDWPDLAPLSATFAREPGGSAAPAAAKPAVDEQPVRPVVVPDTRPRLRQWLSFSTGPAHNPMPVSPITAPAPDPIQSVQVGFLLAMPSPPRPETSASPPELQEMNGLVMGYAQAPWEGDSGQKLSNT